MWVKWVLIGLMCLECIGRIAIIGIPRDPLKPQDAIATLVINAFLIAGLLYYWRA